MHGNTFLILLILEFILVDGMLSSLEEKLK